MSDRLNEAAGVLPHVLSINGVFRRTGFSGDIATTTVMGSLFFASFIFFRTTVLREQVEVAGDAGAPLAFLVGTLVLVSLAASLLTHSGIFRDLLVKYYTLLAIIYSAFGMIIASIFNFFFLRVSDTSPIPYSLWGESPANLAGFDVITYVLASGATYTSPFGLATLISFLGVGLQYRRKAIRAARKIIGEEGPRHIRNRYVAGRQLRVARVLLPRFSLAAWSFLISSLVVGLCVTQADIEELQMLMGATIVQTQTQDL